MIRRSIAVAAALVCSIVACGDDGGSGDLPDVVVDDEPSEASTRLVLRDDDAFLVRRSADAVDVWHRSAPDEGWRAVEAPPLPPRSVGLGAVASARGVVLVVHPCDAVEEVDVGCPDPSPHLVAARLQGDGTWAAPVRIDLGPGPISGFDVLGSSERDVVVAYRPTPDGGTVAVVLAMDDGGEARRLVDPPPGVLPLCATETGDVYAMSNGLPHAPARVNQSPIDALVEDPRRTEMFVLRADPGRAWEPLAARLPGVVPGSIGCAGDDLVGVDGEGRIMAASHRRDSARSIGAVDPAGRGPEVSAQAVSGDGSVAFLTGSSLAVVRGAADAVSQHRLPLAPADVVVDASVGDDRFALLVRAGGLRYEEVGV